MSWILEDNKPVKVRWEGPTLVRAKDGTPVIANGIETFATRRAARDARPRSPSIDRQLEHLARVMGTEQMGFDDIFVPLLARAGELVEIEKAGVLMATTFERVARTVELVPDTNVEDVLTAVRVAVHDRRSLRERVDALTKEVANLHGDLETVAGEHEAVCKIAENAVKERDKLRLEVWALELKAEALHCHQIMLAAERQRLRAALEEKS